LIILELIAKIAISKESAKFLRVFFVRQRESALKYSDKVLLEKGVFSNKSAVARKFAKYEGL